MDSTTNRNIAFLSAVPENPDVRRQVAQWLEQLGYEEAWIGEHHSAAYEIIAPA